MMVCKHSKSPGLFYTCPLLQAYRLVQSIMYKPCVLWILWSSSFVYKS